MAPERLLLDPDDVQGDRGYEARVVVLRQGDVALGDLAGGVEQRGVRQQGEAGRELDCGERAAGLAGDRDNPTP